LIRFVHNFVALLFRLKREFTFIPFFSALSIKDQQEKYFMKTGVDHGRQLSPDTILDRFERVGYYKRPFRQGVFDSGPYGVWTGNTLAHTHEEEGTIKVRQYHFSLQHDLERQIREYWDEKALDAGLEKAAEVWFQRAFDLRPPLRSIAA
jgi:hypothetical protein